MTDTNQTLVESRWNPISLGSSRGGYNINSQSVSSGWYNRYVDSGGTRRTLLRRYNEMDANSVEISRALDIIAEDASSSNADDEPIFELKVPDDSKIKVTHLKLLNAVREVWERRTRMESEFFNRVRDTIKYGATFWKVMNDGSLKRLAPERIVGHIRDTDDEDVVTHYIYDAKAPLLRDHNRQIMADQQAVSRNKDEEYENIPVTDMVVLKVGDGPYGKSILDNVYRSWRQMTLVEDAVIIYRVVRAPERRIYYIDTGNLQGPRREKAMQQQRMNLMQKRANQSGDLSSEFDPHSTSEDIFIPTNSTGKGSRVETLAAGQNLGELSDLQWFAKKVAAGLRIPFSMIDVQSDQQSQSPYSDMRVGQLYQVEMRYVGYIKRMQRQFAEALQVNFEAMCRQQEVSVPFDLDLMINEPNSFSRYKEIEVNQTLLNVFNSTLQIGSLSKRFALQKYMQMEMDELQENEIQKLVEMGIPEDVIKTMEDFEISNIVYGDGRLGEKYGLAPKEEKGFGF